MKKAYVRQNLDSCKRILRNCSEGFTNYNLLTEDIELSPGGPSRPRQKMSYTTIV